MVDGLQLLSQIIGWTYFTAWSISFYPQAYSNFKRKSVHGLSIDFLNYNVVGFLCYSVYNVSLFFSEDIQEEYKARHGNSSSLVEINDVVFAVHAFFISGFTLTQSYFYKRDVKQELSFFARCILGGIGAATSIAIILMFSGVITRLDFLYYSSSIKLGLSLVKYCPQRKSTSGWSIYNILLDFTGGILSILQLLIDAYRLGDWTLFTGNPPKLILGNLSILFDILFMTQHYILYRHPRTPLTKDDFGDHNPESGLASFNPDQPPRKYGSAE
ncbi:hypothetical protein DSO57_1016847 [Entomophthora muscae]|uniref:Uncharacterized protein n=1 Tax=Entomophthora muscae TaxID=34485 RepID=A0ACC2RJA6_9FUNG|nr:hypothetical protein DSO57_1016847 [Entomophthora muscae]